MKFFCATLSHETNRFSPIPTNIASYREFYLYLPSTGEGAHYIEEPMEGVNLYQAIRARGHEVICGLAASAQPSRPTLREDFELLRDEILTNLDLAGPVDGVLLFLHGAQVADGYDDCEGNLIGRVREKVGPGIPIGVEIDLHANVTKAMVLGADFIIPCKEYPHWDFEDRADQMIALMERRIAGAIEPTMDYVRVPMLGTYFTTEQPMRRFVDSLYAMEDGEKILSVSFCHGFPLADIEEAGATVIVVTNGDRGLASRIAEKVADQIFALRDEIATEFRSTEQAFDEAEQAIASGVKGPVVIADAADNPGGGAPGDSTFLLRALLERKIDNAALAMICDPVAVQIAMAAGVGARLRLRIGGKTGPTSGTPLDVEARVIAVREDATQIAQNMQCPLGPAVALAVGGVEIVLNTIRAQTFTPECFTEFGIDARRKDLLVVKSHQHFHEHFAEFAGDIIYTMVQGTVDMSLASVPYRKIQRPAWPLDPIPFTRFGKTWA